VILQIDACPVGAEAEAVGGFVCSIRLTVQDLVNGTTGGEFVQEFSEVVGSELLNGLREENTERIASRLGVDDGVVLARESTLRSEVCATRVSDGRKSR
jgi:hypothetical protein